jgi:hypothetical protein
MLHSLRVQILQVISNLPLSVLRSMFLFFADSNDSLKVNKRFNTYVHYIIPPNLWNFVVVVVVIRFAFSSSSLLRRLEILINFISLEEFRAAITMLHSLRIQILQVVRNILHLLDSG